METRLRRVHQTNSRMTKRLQLAVLQMAKRFDEYNEFFFVWQNDFRGRKYVVSSFLTPQGQTMQVSVAIFRGRTPDFTWDVLVGCTRC